MAKKPAIKQKAARLCAEDYPVVPPPSTVSVQHDYKPVLYTADGKVLVRRAGY